jgi:hypothetical protein
MKRDRRRHNPSLNSWLTQYDRAIDNINFVNAFMRGVELGKSLSFSNETGIGEVLTACFHSLRGAHQALNDAYNRAQRDYLPGENK